MRPKTKILLGLLILAACLLHLLFLLQIDYVVYDHDQRHTAKPALGGYYQLQNGQISNFIKDMFSHHEGWPRSPAFIGYLTALFCYLFGLNEIMMRCVTWLFYLILIYYTYRCTKELDSEQAGILSILILITMPVVVSWSRMVFPVFCGMAFLMAVFYYMLRSKYFISLYNSIWFGLFSGLCLLTHRVMFVPLIVLWTVAVLGSFKGKDIVRSIRGLLLASLTAFVVSGRFLMTYFNTYDSYRDLGQYSLSDNMDYFRLNNVLWRLKESVTQFGYDNLAIIFLLIILAVIWKRKEKFQNKIKLFQYFAATSFCLFLGIWFVVTYFSKIRIINVRHFQIFAPMIAIAIAIYLNRARPSIKYIVISIKGILMLSLTLMILPSLGNSYFLSPFRNYFHIPNIDGHGNGVIWSDRTFARGEELDYFRGEISKADIAVMNMPVWNHLVSLCDRLQLNAVGRSVFLEDANPLAGYLMFYCVSSDNLEEYLSCRSEYAGYAYGTDRAESLLEIEKFINESIVEEMGPDEKVAIINTDGNFRYANAIRDYITNFNFKKARCLRYYVGNTKKYKVIFKCAENLSELMDFEEWRRHQCILQKFH